MTTGWHFGVLISEIIMQVFSKFRNCSVKHFFKILNFSHFYIKEFRDPSSFECRTKAQSLAEEYWALYNSDIRQESDCRILPYPIAVDKVEGKVSALDPPYDQFPDVGGSVLGKKSGIIPSKVTT